MRSLAFLALVLAGCVDAGATAPSPTSSGGKADGDANILLDCNTSVGPDQQVTVLDNGDGTLVLRELTTSGAQVDRALSATEWTGEVLALRDDGFGSTSTLRKDSDSWVVQSTGGGVNELGDADCWTDASR